MGDVEAPQAPPQEDALYYTLSTIAQSGAALAAILGAFGLWRLGRLRELNCEEEERQYETERELRQIRHAQETDDTRAVALMAVQRLAIWDVIETQRLELRLEGIHARHQYFEDERRYFIDTLVVFLLGPLAIVGLALVILTAIRRPRTLVALAVALLSLVWGQSGEAAGRHPSPPQCCVSYEERTLGRWHTPCQDSTRAISTYNGTQQHWESIATLPLSKACTGRLHPSTRLVEVRCR